MLYPEKQTSSLDAALFENPPKQYRGTPFFSFNCKLEKDVLLWQIEQLKKMGFGGFHMHARAGLDTDYLSDEFMDMIRACCDKAEAEDMLAWLYDEDRFASGFAGGKVTCHPEYRRRLLQLYGEDKGWNTPKATAITAGEPYFLACYDVQLDTDGYLTGFARIGRDDAATGRKYYAYTVPEAPATYYNNQTYPANMDEETVATFIKVTHERYKEAVGERFGKSVPAIFTDEPNIQNCESYSLPQPFHDRQIAHGWSRYFEEAYQAHFGRDILDELPLLFWITADRRDAAVKYRYFDLCATLFSQNYCWQIGNWCRKNGIAFTGHLLHEPNLAGQTYTCGELMRSYDAFTIPGIDMLCNNREFNTAKQAQSAVHQYGKEGMMSELYGVTNWDFDFRGHKFQGDWQAALGVTVRVPHLAWVSMAGAAKRDYPAAIGYQSPWFAEYPLIENHFARLNTALTRGTPLISIGVIHPVESYWISTGPDTQTGTGRKTLEEHFAHITDWLLSQHLDYDFICESQIPAMADAAHPGKIGQMQYAAIVVPGCLTLRSTTLAFLDAFRAAGGRVIFMGSCPTFTDGAPGDGSAALYAQCPHIDFSEIALATALQPVREISVRGENGQEHPAFLYAYRQDTDGRWLFLARKDLPGYTYGVPQYDVVAPDKTVITVKGVFTPVVYDTLTGETYPLSYRIENGCTVIPHAFDGCDSLLLKLTAATAERLTVPAVQKTAVCRLDYKHTVPFTMSEPNVLLLDTAAYALDDGDFHETEELLRADNAIRAVLGFPQRSGQAAQPYTLPPEPETHTVRLRFTFNSEIAVQGALLAAEDAEKLTISLNGTPVPATVCGYFTDKCIKTVALPEIRKGENTLLLSLPFGKRTNIEWCYILGSFGVRVNGCDKTLTALPATIGFGDAATQGLPFYGANLSYTLPVTLPQDGTLEIHAPSYRGALIGVSIDGKRAGNIVFPPYNCTVEDVAAGAHTVTLTLFGNRFNSFGQLHLVNESERWFGPNSWRSEGDNWCYEYKLRRFGILKSPVITLLK